MSPVLARSFAVFALLALGCAAAGEQAPSALEAAVSDDEDLGDPRKAPEELSDEEKSALLNDPNAEQMDFDGDQANDSPTDIITTPGDREPMPSMMKTIRMGPSS